MPPGNSNGVNVISESAKNVKRVKKNVKRIYLIPWRPEECEELTNPANGFDISFVYTLAMKLGKLAPCVVNKSVVMN